MSFILNNYVEILAAVGAFLSFATIVTKLTPTPKDDAILAKVKRAFEFFSINLKK